jgi:hypothetical protein
VSFGSAQNRPFEVRPQKLEKTDFRINDSLEQGASRSGRRAGKNRAGKNKEAKIEDYKIISHANDTTYVDTTLTIYKEYKYNYLRKDNFDLLPFSNMGQSYNSMSYNFSGKNLTPQFGARARHFNFLEIEDINYFYMPTPFTELMFKTVFEQGQLLDSFFTVNTSPQFNFSIAYKGLRSLGKYQHILTSTGNFRFTFNYKTRNKRYNARGHIVSQDQFNEENGGLDEEGLANFESGNPEFIDRAVFDPRFENAESMLRGSRFHLEHNYNLIQKRDSISSKTLSIGNMLTFEHRFFEFEQSRQDEFFGAAFLEADLKDKVTWEIFNAEANATYFNEKLGRLKLNVGYHNFNYGYNDLVSLEGNLITNRLKGDVIMVGGAYKNNIGGFLIDGSLGINVAGDFDGNFLDAKAGYRINPDAQVEGRLNINSRAPNYNYLLYHSDYINYNWENNYRNIETRQFSFSFHSDKWLNAELDYTSVDNYTYFMRSGDEDLVKPHQANETVNYFRVKLEREFTYGKFALNNTLRYQSVLDGDNIVNVPEIITRNTLYFSDHLFKRALYLQTGIIFSYFTKYNMNAYDPVLAEFFVQDEVELGAFPRLDFFVNAKIRQTRIYFKAEHFNSSFTGYNFYSAPGYPYRDFTIRFGLVWNFFL